MSFDVRPTRDRDEFRAALYAIAQNFGAPPSALSLSEFAYSGHWTVGDDKAVATAVDSRIDVKFRARRVYLVLGSTDRNRALGVELDGKPISAADAGSDVKGGSVTVGAQRLYNLVNLPGVQDHTLTLRFAPGITGFAFTFG